MSEFPAPRAEPAASGRIVSIQVGKPRPIESGGGERWTSGYGKAPVPGPVAVRKLNLDGDGQADARWHGGPDMAVLAYAAAHYPLWRDELGWPELAPGAFAENLTVEGFDERTVCLGDVWEAGGVQLQVSQPRKPCRNISRFWGRRDLLKQVERSGRIGWYLRVLREGSLQAGQPLARVARPHPEWTVERAMGVRRARSRDPGAARELAACPALGADWRERLLE